MILNVVISLALLVGASPPEKPFRTETVVYAQPGDESLKATLYLPAAEPKGLRPAIVLIHGGGWAMGSRRQPYWYGHHFAEAGYVAMSVDYRTMPGALFPAPLFDVKSAVRWLRRNAETYRIDPNRIAALGTSAGGHLALMLALTASEKDLEGAENPGYSCEVQAAVSLYGPTNLRSLIADEDKSRIARNTWEPYVKDFAGEKKLGGREPLDAASPVSYAGHGSPPILCIQGSSDALVPVEQARDLVKKLKDAGASVQYIEVPGYGHAFDTLHPSVRRELFPKILAFLNEHMGKGGEEGNTK